MSKPRTMADELIDSWAQHDFTEVEQIRQMANLADQLEAQSKALLEAVPSAGEKKPAQLSDVDDLLCEARAQLLEVMSARSEKPAIERPELWAEWCVRALVALASRNLEERNKTCGKNWPAGQMWDDLGHTSQHAFIRAATAEAGIPHETYRQAVEQAFRVGVDLDDVWTDMARRMKDAGR